MRVWTVCLMLALGTAAHADPIAPPEAGPPPPPEQAAPAAPAAPVAPVAPVAPQAAETPPPAAQPAPAQATATEHIAPEEAKSVLGQQVFTTDGAAAGRLVDVIVDQDGTPRAGVIDFGGFMGLGNRHISVAWSALHFDPANKEHPITLALTPEQIRAAPDFKAPDKPAEVVTPTSTP